MLASISTSLAEILGGAIALQMLFGVPVRIGALLVLVFVVVMLFTNSYRLIEKWIIAFVSIIGLSFIYELSLVTIDWPQAARAWVTPSFPEGSMVIIMSVLGAVVMPHNLFLHSEVIQSRQWNLSDDAVIRRQLRYEYADTIFSMLVGWAINSAMILLAAATFFVTKTPVEELQQADSLLQPLLGAKRDAYLCRRPALRGDLLDDHLGDGRGLDLRRDIQRALRHQGQPLPDGA